MHQAHLLRSVPDDRNEKALHLALLFLLLVRRARRGRGPAAAVGAAAVGAVLLLRSSSSERRPHEQLRVHLPESRRREIDAHLLRVLPDRRREDGARDLGAFLFGWVKKLFFVCVVGQQWRGRGEGTGKRNDACSALSRSLFLSSYTLLQNNNSLCLAISSSDRALSVAEIDERSAFLEERTSSSVEVVVEVVARRRSPPGSAASPSLC